MNNNENSNIAPSSSTRNLRYDGWADVHVKDYAHIYSDGTNVSVLFQSREDYVFGMNVIAVTAFICGITILTIQVMETHFHIIAKPEGGSRSKEGSRSATIPYSWKMS